MVNHTKMIGPERHVHLCNIVMKVTNKCLNFYKMKSVPVTIFRLRNYDYLIGPKEEPLMVALNVWY